MIADELRRQLREVGYALEGENAAGEYWHDREHARSAFLTLDQVSPSVYGWLGDWDDHDAAEHVDAPLWSADVADIVDAIQDLDRILDRTLDRMFDEMDCQCSACRIPY